MKGDPAFFERLLRPAAEPDRLTASGWQCCDDDHPPETGQPAYRVVYKTLRLVPFPAVLMTWPNMRLVIANGDIDRGGLRVPGGIAGRTPTTSSSPNMRGSARPSLARPTSAASTRPS